MRKAIIDYLLQAYRNNQPEDVLAMYERDLYELPMPTLAERFLDVLSVQEQSFKRC